MPTDGYYLDLNQFSIQKLKDLLKSSRLLPSQKILLEEIDERFNRLKENGIENLEDLQKTLKTKAKVSSFSQETDVPIEYLTVLRREVNSYQPKPINLGDFPNVNPEAVERLKQQGIKNTKQLFPNVLTPESRMALARSKGIADDDLLEFTKLTDVARLKWVGPKFARLLIETEYDTVVKIANCDYRELNQALLRINEEKNIYKGSVGLEDLKNWVHRIVQDVPQVIVY